jgi:mono/diheme cytochrome c family protein
MTGKLSGHPVPGRMSILFRAFAMLVLALATLFGPKLANAAQPELVVTKDAGEQRFTAAELLARPDAALLSVNGDIYHHAVTYRAVPLLSLLGSNLGDRFDTVEARASDGFVSQIPLALIARGASGGAVAWIAAEDPASPWPPLPHKSESAGPFYLVWEHPERSNVSREQWPFQLVRLTLVESPIRRWPQLVLPANLPASSLARHGQDVFLTQCFTCHRLNGGGVSDVGPDLGRPMNATRYLTDAGLRAIIRNPRAVRTWPAQQMAGFDKAALDDADLDAVVAYLHAMADATGPSSSP